MSVDSPPSLVQIRIRGIAHGGEGVGRRVDDPEGVVCFVEGALPGELVDVSVERRARNFTRGTAISVIEPADARIEPACRYASDCGGCDWQHVAPDAALTFKRDIVADQLRRLDIPTIDVHASPQANAYRRRARLHYQRTEHGLRLGFHVRRSRDIVDVDHCYVLRPELDAALQRVRELAVHLPASGEIVALSNGSEVVVGLVGVRGSEDLQAAARSLLNSTLVGIEWRGGRTRGRVGKTVLADRPDDDRLRTSAFGFSQAQGEQNDELRAVVAGFADRGDDLLELFAGAGNFTRDLAPRFGRSCCVEHDREAADQARRMTKAIGRRVQIVRSKAEAAITRFAAAGRTFDVSILDPPRTGLGAAAMTKLCEITRTKIGYVSCDPATLARDLAAATEVGFAISTVHVFDFMPMTSQIEVFVGLTRRAATRPGRPHGQAAP